MNPDYTINDAFHDGFECGLLYILRYVNEHYYQSLSSDDIDVSELALHLAEKKPWKTAPEWQELILNSR